MSSIGTDILDVIIQSKATKKIIEYIFATLFIKKKKKKH